MATKQTMALAVVLLLSTLVMTALGTLQEIPDDKVYTEIQKTLINGTWGILTCRFTGPPYAVYWKKGLDPWTSPTLMTWTPDGKTGPRYEDGTCDMDENYSLVIKTVDYTDAGRYICLVSNQHGVLRDNFTDVTVTDIAIKTEPTVSMQMSRTGFLPCQVNIRPKKVSWMRSPDTAVVTMDRVRIVIKRSGPGYKEGRFNISKKYVTIKVVTIQHEEITDFDTDAMYQDFFGLNVFAQPSKPFLIEDQSNRIITAASPIIFTHNVSYYYPDNNLGFLHGSVRVDPLTTLTYNRTDGTKNKSATISADISRDVYKCIASGIPGFDLNGESSSSVRLMKEESNSPSLAVLIFLIKVCPTVVLLAWLVVCMVVALLALLVVYLTVFLLDWLRLRERMIEVCLTVVLLAWLVVCVVVALLALLVVYLTVFLLDWLRSRKRMIEVCLTVVLLAWLFVCVVVALLALLVVYLTVVLLDWLRSRERMIVVGPTMYLLPFFLVRQTCQRVDLLDLLMLGPTVNLLDWPRSQKRLIVICPGMDLLDFLVVGPTVDLLALLALRLTVDLLDWLVVCLTVNLLAWARSQKRYADMAEGWTPRIPPSIPSYSYEYSLRDGVVFNKDSQKALRRGGHQDHGDSPKKRRTTGIRRSPWLALLPSFIQMFIVMAIILTGSPVLVAGGVSAEQVILRAGQSAVIPFNIPRPPDNISQIFPHYILSFASKARPFCINGEVDLKGFKSPSQLTRFTTSVDEKASSICVKLHIDPVGILDEDMYVLQAIFHDFGVRQETVMKEILVRIPPGPAKCFITKSENNNCPYEVHCQATIGSWETTLTCFQNGQNGQKVKLVGDLTKNGRVIKGVFLLPYYTYFSCCSHVLNFTVNEKMCNDFEWPPSKHSTISPSVIHPSFTQSVAHPVAGIGNTEQESKTLLESEADSSSCKQCMASSAYLTMGIMIYFLISVNVK